MRAPERYPVTKVSLDEGVQRSAHASLRELHLASPSMTGPPTPAPDLEAGSLQEHFMVALARRPTRATPALSVADLSDDDCDRRLGRPPLAAPAVSPLAPNLVSITPPSSRSGH